MFFHQKHIIVAEAGIRVDEKEKTVYVSSIFKWFGDDFVNTYGSGTDFTVYGKTQGAVLHFIAEHLVPKERELLISEKYDIQYLSYDTRYLKWSLLNRQFHFDLGISP